MFEEVVQVGKVKITLKNNLRNLITLRKWHEVWDINPDLPDSDIRTMFVDAVSHMSNFEGLKFTKPSENASSADLEKSYQEMVSNDNITREILRQCTRAVNRLHEPLSDDLEKPDEFIEDPN